MLNHFQVKQIRASSQKTIFSESVHLCTWSTSAKILQM